MIIKGGMIAYAQMGDPNASIPTPQPLMMRPMFAPPHLSSLSFVSQASLVPLIFLYLYLLWTHIHTDKSVVCMCSSPSPSPISLTHAHPPTQNTTSGYGLRKRVEPVRRCRGLAKHDMPFNHTLPAIHVDPETCILIISCLILSYLILSNHIISYQIILSSCIYSSIALMLCYMSWQLMEKLSRVILRAPFHWPKHSY